MGNGKKRIPITETTETRPRSPKPARPQRALDEDTTVVNFTKGPAALATAMQRCLAHPEEAAAWDELEHAAETRADTQSVADLHRATLQRELPAALLVEIGARAVRFHDEWALGDEALIALLVRVLTVDPTVKWAFDRLSLELTMRDRREELLWLYDRVLGAVEGTRRIALLEEAADVARRGQQIDRAIGYLERLFDADPRRAAIAASLERLLEQRARHADLLALWKRRMDVEAPAEAARLRCRAAGFCLDTMDDPAAALETLQPLEEEPGTEREAACALLERVIDGPAATPASRLEALARLRARYDAAAQPCELVRALRSVLARASDATPELDVARLHAEIAQRLVRAGREDEATGDLAALISLDARGDDALVEALSSDALEEEIFGCSPRFERDRRLDLVRRAAEHAATRGATERAIALYRHLLREVPSDERVIAGLGELYSAGERHEALVELREHELALASDVARRQSLRLELARLHLRLGTPASAVRALRENLEERPADEATIDAVVATLAASETFGALCDLLEEHAAAVASTHPEIAKGLWGQAAELAERRLDDLRRAVRDHEQIVAASPRSPAPSSLDALGRLHTELGEHEAAARWLAELVACDRTRERGDDVLRLAKARVAVGQPAEALACIETFLAEEPGDLRLRMMQIELLRASGDLEALVAALVAAAPHAEGAAESALLREAAKVLARDLDDPTRAVALLERAVALPETPTAACIDLADALFRAGRLADAQQIAKGVLSELGRRHPPERAGLHLLLGRIAREQGNAEETQRELEAAVAMDVSNPHAQLLLGKISRELGHLERAERAFSALSLLQRRSGGAEDQPPMSETFVELHRLAALRGHSDQAAEHLAAAFEIAQRSEREARGLERALREAQMPALLAQALQGHLARVSEPAARATLLGESAEVLGALGRHDEAALAALQGVALAPEDASLHARAALACSRTKQLDRYAASLGGLVATALGAGDGVLGCTLLLRLGELHEMDPARLDEAQATYARAEDTGENLLEVWRRKARLAARRGDRATQLEALRKLVDAASELEAGERADTLYALAELELRASETVEPGLASLTLAMENEARPARAVALLRAALDFAVDAEPVARLYESVAREHGDDATLLDALTVLCSSTRPAQAVLREAVDLAERREAEGRALQLLERAVVLAREGVDAGEGLWAMQRLVDARERRGEMRAAASWARQAAELASADESAPLWMRAAVLATRAGDLDAAIDCYEKRLASDPGDATAWAAMLSILRDAGDGQRLDAALVKAVEAGHDPRERNELRMERARRLLEDAAKRSDALDTLHAVLDEQPDHTEAAGLLVGLLDPEGDRDDLVALLGRRLEVAEERGDANVGASLALRLADLLEPAAALDVIRGALRWAPSSVPLLRKRVELLDPELEAAERADAIEQLLEHERGDARRDRALELLRARLAAGDADAVERAIERVREIDPSHPDVAAALAWLADAKVAEAAEDPGAAARILRRAAQIRHSLGDADGALEALDAAQRAEPDDLELLALRAQRMLDVDRGDEAVALVMDGIERCADDDERSLLALLLAMDRARQAAEDPRELTLHQADLLERLGRRADARALLAGLADEEGVLWRMLDLDIAEDRWDDAIDDCEKLLASDASELADIALRLAYACDAADRPEDARDALERALDEDPANAEVLDALQDVYLRTGAYRELANRLFADAQRTDDDRVRFDRLLEVGRLRLEHLEEPATAVGPLSDALALQPGHQRATLLLAEALAGAGLGDDAVALLEAAIARHAGRRSRELGELQHAMARVVGDQDPAAALKWLVAAFESYPKNAAVAEELASRGIALAQFDLAMRALRTLTARDFEPEVRARAYLGQAHVALKQANSARALMFAKKAYAEAPELAAVGHMLRSLDQRSN